MYFIQLTEIPLAGNLMLLRFFELQQLVVKEILDMGCLTGIIDGLYNPSGQGI